jgi:CDP-diacylglycerol--glycerol-3-phosphate 3-phosphatidyltransferase
MGNRATIANIITLTRIALIPVFFILLSINVIAALVLYIALCISDLLDGWLARKRNETSEFGKAFDQISDKLLVTTALLWLVGVARIPDWMAIIIICRELLILGLRMLSPVVIPAVLSGKIKVNVQFIAIGAAIIQFPYYWYIMLIAVLVTIYSGIDYWIKLRKNVQI